MAAKNENYDPKPNLKVWLNGQFLPAPQAAISVFDHGLLYGDGVFEGIRVYSGRIFAKHEHIRRFVNSAKGIRLELPYTYEQINEALEATIEANDLLGADKDGYIRLVATRGVGVLGISPVKTWKPSMYVIADSIEMYPAELYEKGMPVIISSVTRNSNNAMPPQIKSLNYLNNILGKIEAHDAGVMEAIMLNAQGNVAEATGDNVFIVRFGQLQTPPTAAGLLEGITRRNVIELARERGIEVVEKDLTRMDLYSAEECFLCGTGAEIIGVVSIDGRAIADGQVGPITRDLIQAYRKLVRAHVEDVEGLARRATAAVRSN